MTESLYKIGAQIAEIEALDLTDEEKRDTLDAIDAQFDQKAEAVAAYIKDLELKSKNANDEARRLQERSKDLLKQAERMNRYLTETMQKLDKPNIVGSLFTLSVQKGRESVVVDVDECELMWLNNSLSIELVKEEKSFKTDKTAIKNAIKAGIEVKGAHIERGEDKVRIK